MDKLLKLMAAISGAVNSKQCTFVLKLTGCVHLISFVLLFLSDCLHVRWLQAGRLHLIFAAALAATSYLCWLLMTFMAVGYFCLRKFGPMGPEPNKSRLLNLVRAVGYPAYFLVCVAWATASLAGPVPWLGNLALGASIALEIARQIARRADRKPPRGPRKPVGFVTRSRQQLPVNSS